MSFYIKTISSINPCKLRRDPLNGRRLLGICFIIAAVLIFFTILWNIVKCTAQIFIVYIPLGTGCSEATFLIGDFILAVVLLFWGKGLYKDKWWPTR